MITFQPAPSLEMQQELWQSWRGLSRLWNLTKTEQENLLGTARGTSELWSKDDPGMTERMASRMGTLFECYKFLRLTFGSEENSLTWLRSPNKAEIFSGRTPLDVMMTGGDEALEATHGYLARACDCGMSLDQDGHLCFTLKLLNAGKPTPSAPPKPPRPE